MAQSTITITFPAKDGSYAIEMPEGKTQDDIVELYYEAQTFTIYAKFNDNSVVQIEAIHEPTPTTGNVPFWSKP